MYYEMSTDFSVLLMEIILQIVILSENNIMLVHVTNCAESDICLQSQSYNLHIKISIK